MRPYMPPGRATEDPMDGPYPTRRSRWAGRKRRAALRRKMRSHKKGARRWSSEQARSDVAAGA